MKSAYEIAKEELSNIGEFVAGSDNGNDSSNKIDRSNNTIAISVYNPTNTVLPAKLFNYYSSYFLPAPPPSVVGVQTAMSFTITPRFGDYCPVNNSIYVGTSNDVEVIDCATNTPVTSFGLGSPTTIVGVTYNPLSNTMYACCRIPGDVYVLDCATNALITTIPLGQASDAAYCPVNNTMFITRGGAGVLEVIDCFTNTSIFSIIIGPGYDSLEYNPVNNSVFVVGNNNILQVVNCTTFAVTSSIISVGNHTAISYCAPNNTMYVVNQTSNNVDVINGATFAVIGAPINVGATPVSIAYNLFDNLMYVTNSVSIDVSVIDCATNLVTNTIPILSAPEGIIYCFSNNTMYTLEPFGLGFGSFTPIAPAVPFVATSIVSPSGGVTMAEIYNDTQGKPFNIKGMKIITDNFLQFSNNLIIGNSSYTGMVDSNQIQPLNYVSPANPNPIILDMTDLNLTIDRGPDATGIDFNVEPFTKIVFICTIGESLDPVAIFSKNKMEVQETKIIRNTGNPIIDMILKHDFKDKKIEEGEYFTTTEESVYPRLTGNPIADIALFRETGIQGIG